MSVANRSLRPKRSGKKKDKVKGLPPFVSKLYTIVDDPAVDHVISWGPTSETFIVHKPEELCADVLPIYFKHSNYCSFIRQVNTYGFTKVSPETWEFSNEFFKKGRTDLLPQVIRRTSVKRSPETQKEEKKSKSKFKEGDITMQVEELEKANSHLQKELEKLKEERQTHEQLVSYFVEELKQSKNKQKELQEREKQMMALLQKIIYTQGTATAGEQQRRRFQPKPQAAPVGDELVNAFLGVKKESSQKVGQNVPTAAEHHPTQLPYPETLQAVPNSPLWNSWPTDFFGNLMEDQEPYLNAAPREQHDVLDAELDADLASMVDEMSFDSNFTPSHMHAPTANGSPHKRSHLPSSTTTTTTTSTSTPFQNLFLSHQPSGGQQTQHPQHHDGMHPFSPTQTPLPGYRFQPQYYFNMQSNGSGGGDYASLTVPQSPQSSPLSPQQPQSPQLNLNGISPRSPPEPLSNMAPLSPLSPLSPLPPLSPSQLNLDLPHFIVKEEGGKLNITSSSASSPARPSSSSTTHSSASPLQGLLSSPLPASPPMHDESASNLAMLDSSFVVLDGAGSLVQNPDDCLRIEELAGQLQQMTSG